MSVSHVQYANEEAWLAARIDGGTIGASEAPLLFGEVSERMDRDKARTRLIAEKVSGVRRKASAADKRRREAGKVLEARGGALLAEKLKRPVVPLTFRIYQNTELPGLHATPDFILPPDPILAEIKAIGPDGYAGWGDFSGYQGRWKWSDEAPLRVQIQCQAQMGATGATHTYIVCVFGTDWHMWLIARDEELIQMIADAVCVAVEEINEARESRKEAQP